MTEPEPAPAPAGTPPRTPHRGDTLRVRETFAPYDADPALGAIVLTPGTLLRVDDTLGGIIACTVLGPDGSPLPDGRSPTIALRKAPPSHPDYVWRWADPVPAPGPWDRTPGA